MDTSSTFLTLGQRYTRSDEAGWRADHQIVIVAVDPDTDGGTLVTYRCPGGRLVRGGAAEFELALAVGEIVPVVGMGRIAAC